MLKNTVGIELLLVVGASRGIDICRDKKPRCSLLKYTYMQGRLKPQNRDEVFPLPHSLVML